MEKHLELFIGYASIHKENGLNCKNRASESTTCQGWLNRQGKRRRRKSNVAAPCVAVSLRSEWRVR